MEVSIRIGGFGGQGILLAGRLLGEAVVLCEGKYASQSIGYGPEARLGDSHSEIVIADTFISYPKPTYVDIFVAMSQESFDKYFSKLKKNGILVIDSTYVKNYSEKEIRDKGCKLYAFPFSQYCREKFHTELCANIMILGFISELTKIVKKESLEERIKSLPKKKFIDINLRALEEGVKIAKNMESLK